MSADPNTADSTMYDPIYRERVLARAEAAALAGSGNRAAALEHDRDTCLIDTLANLWHYADAHGLDFEQLVRSAETHHTAEMEVRS